MRVNQYKYPLAIGASLILGLILGTAGLSKALNPAEIFIIFTDPFNPFPRPFHAGDSPDGCYLAASH